MVEVMSRIPRITQSNQLKSSHDESSGWTEQSDPGTATDVGALHKSRPLVFDQTSKNKLEKNAPKNCFFPLRKDWLGRDETAHKTSFVRAI